MAYVEVDIDLADLETWELCKELSRRLKTVGRKKLDAKEKASLREDLTVLNQELGLTFSQIKIETLEDKMKLEHLAKIWIKYSSAEIENLLP